MKRRRNVNDIPSKVKLNILQGKLQLYRNTYYAHQVDAQIGKDIGDEKMVEAAKENMRKAQQCIDAIEGMLAELGQSED